MIKIQLTVSTGANQAIDLQVYDESVDGDITEIGQFKTLRIMTSPYIKRLRAEKQCEVLTELALAKVAYDNLDQSKTTVYQWRQGKACYELDTSQNHSADCMDGS